MKPETNSYSDPLSFIWNGKRPEEFGFYLYDLPTIQTSNEDYEVISVPGMRGQLIRPGGSFRNIGCEAPGSCVLLSLKAAFIKCFKLSTGT